MEKHSHLEHMLCRDPFCNGPRPDMYIPLGPVSGLRFLAIELMLFLDADPDQNPEVLGELEQEIGEAMLDIGRELLAERGVHRDLPELVK